MWLGFLLLNGSESTAQAERVTRGQREANPTQAWPLPLEGDRNMMISAMFSTHPGPLGDATEMGRPREDHFRRRPPPGEELSHLIYEAKRPETQMNGSKKEEQSEGQCVPEAGE